MLKFNREELMVIDRALQDRINVLPAGGLCNMEVVKCKMLRDVIAPLIAVKETK